MRLMNIAPFVLLASVAGVQACGNPNVDDSRTDRRLFQVKGVIQGAVTYTGVRPCSRNGHIVGSAILLVFDAKNPPPPAGLANTAVNFGVVAGDVLFANEPRNPGDDLYCPKDNGRADPILVSAPFVIAPMDDGQYIIQAFYDYTGDFLPTFKIRNLPEMGDALGGYVDTTDAAKHVGDINYVPRFIPINIGYPDVKSPSGFTIPSSGFVADDVAVTVGTTAPIPRPYFYPRSVANMDTSAKPVLHAPDAKGSAEPCAHPNAPDPNDDNDKGCAYVPVITMAADYHVKAQPTAKTEDNINEQQDSFVQMDLVGGVPDAELPAATTIGDPKLPFHFQAPPFAKGGGLFAWADSVKKIPETNLIPQIWPLVVFAKLKDDRGTDPQNLVAQGSKTEPAIVIQGLTVNQDSLFASTRFGPGVPSSPAAPGARVDHVRVLVRPSAICFNASSAAGIAQGGVLVTPFQQGRDPGSGPLGMEHDTDKERFVDIVDLAQVVATSGGLIRKFQIACLPQGRYGINAVYPTGQAWTVPNEAGNCSPLEGQIGGDYSKMESLTCSAKTRPVLYSQGTRAILEITAPSDPKNCPPMPDECLPCDQRADPGKFPECAP